MARLELQCRFCSRRYTVPDEYLGPLEKTLSESGWDPTPGCTLCPSCKKDYDRERIAFYRRCAGVYNGGLTGGL